MKKLFTQQNPLFDERVVPWQRRDGKESTHLESEWRELFREIKRLQIRPAAGDGHAGSRLTHAKSAGQVCDQRRRNGIARSGVGGRAVLFEGERTWGVE